MSDIVLGFADGENLIRRYQDMVGAGARPKANVIHVEDVLVWHPDLTQTYLCDISRITYYQTCVGDDPRLNVVRQQIKDVAYSYNIPGMPGNVGTGSLVPRVFKKENRSSKTKSVDINLTIDMLRHAASRHADVLLLLSGDGDYLPLIEEVSRSGKRVWLAAFSSGLNPSLKFAADDFIDLDQVFFDQETQEDSSGKRKPR